MKGEAWLCRVRRGYVRVRRGYVVSASNPARHPSLGSAHTKVSEQIFPSAAAGDSSAAAGYQPITKDEYCINTVDRKLEK
jgi:hypothetical protein